MKGSGLFGFFRDYVTSVLEGLVYAGALTYAFTASASSIHEQRPSPKAHSSPTAEVRPASYLDEIIEGMERRNSRINQYIERLEEGVQERVRSVRATQKFLEKQNDRLEKSINDAEESVKQLQRFMEAPPK